MLTKSENVEVSISSLSFRTKDARQRDTTTIAEVGVDLSLDHRLAIDVLPALGDDLFTVRGTDGEYVPKADMREAGYDLPNQTYLLALRTTPDVLKDTRIEGVTVRKLHCHKGEGNAWRLAFTLGFVLVDPKDALIFVKHLKKTLFITLREQTPKLEGEEWNPDKAADAPQADVDGGGVVQSIRGRGEKRKRAGDDVVN